MLDIFSLHKWAKKTFTRTDVVFGAVFFTVFLATRLYKLDGFPIFSDEGIYIRWAKTAWHDASWRFISLTDGKQPLQTWGTIPFLKLYPENALLGGRLFAVSGGFFALVGMITLLATLFGRKAAHIGGILYVLNPYFLFYDRLALVDSTVNGFAIWIFVGAVLLAKHRRFDTALVLGLVSGMGLLAKSSVQMFVGLGAFAGVFLLQKHKQKSFKDLINFGALYGFVAVMAVVIYNIQRLSPFMHYVAEKNTTFVLTFSEFMTDPFTVFGRNWHLIPEYVSAESGLFFSILGIMGVYLIFKKDWRMGLYVVSWIVIPYLLVGFFSKVLFPRYIIFFGSVLIITASYFIANIDAYVGKKGIKIGTALIGLYLVSVAYANYTILADYKNIPLPPIDRGQYIEGWPAGWGAREIVEYARAKSAEKPVVIVAEGNFGMSADVLDTFTKPGDQIYIKGYWPLGEAELIENQKELENNHVLVVLSHKFDYPEEWPITLIQRYDRPGNQSVLYLFELTP